MKPASNGKWVEPDAAAGIAWVQYTAWLRFKDKKFLEAADGCMNFLHERKDNPYYELQLPFGAYIAARMNDCLPTLIADKRIRAAQWRSSAETTM